jgi:hypothetical protein
MARAVRSRNGVVGAALTTMMTFPRSQLLCLQK